MNKNVGVIAIPYEIIMDMNIAPEDVKPLLELPDDVYVYKTYEDWYRQTFNIMLISDHPVEGFTYPTPPGLEASVKVATYKDGKIVLNRA